MTEAFRNDASEWQPPSHQVTRKCDPWGREITATETYKAAHNHDTQLRVRRLGRFGFGTWHDLEDADGATSSRVFFISNYKGDSIYTEIGDATTRTTHHYDERGNWIWRKQTTSYAGVAAVEVDEDEVTVIERRELTYAD